MGRGSLSADTYINRVGPMGSIVDVVLNQSTRWTTAGSPYIVEAHLTVAADVGLQVDPGVTVRISGGKGLYVNGTIAATGTTFGSNGAGNWLGLYLSPASGASVVDGCTFSGAAAASLGFFNNAYRQAAIYVNACSPTIKNCQFIDNLGHGVELWSSSGIVMANSFVNVAAGYYPVVYDTVGAFPVVGGNSASGLGNLGVAVPGGALVGAQTWGNPGPNLPYLLTGDVTIPETVQLTIDPGTRIATVNQRLWVYGTLVANGTAASPVVFTSRASTPAAGDWFGLYFGGQSGASRLNYTTVAYAGKDSLVFAHNAYRSAALYVDGSGPVFDHLTVQASGLNGIEVYGGTPSILTSTIVSSGGHGFKAEASSRPMLSQVTFADNGKSGDGYYTIGTDAGSVPNPSGILFQNNRLQGVQIWGGTTPTNVTWKVWAANAPYVITSDVSTPADSTLTIQPGAVVKFQKSGLFVGGTLAVDGGSDQAVSFSSWRDDAIGGDSNGDKAATAPAAGDWKGIYLSPASGNSSFNNCRFSYAGMNNLLFVHNAYRLVTLYVDGCSPVFTNCVVADSAVHGIELWDSQAKILNSSFRNFGADAYPIVYDRVVVFPKLMGNTVSGSGILGVAVPGGTMDSTNVWNRPGANVPYYLNGELGLAEGANWTLDPGVAVKSAGQRVMISGSVFALGSVLEPVVFTSRNATPLNGDWQCLYLGATAGKSVLSNVVVSFGGRLNSLYVHNAYRSSSIYVDGSSPLLQNVRILNSLYNGLEMYASNLRLGNASIESSGAYAMVAELGSRPVLNQVSFKGNGVDDPGVYTIGMDASCVPDPTLTTFSNNRQQGIRIWGGTVPSEATWKVWATNAPYVITEDVGVAAAATLTVAPGATIKMRGTGLYVSGTLRADGGSSPIQFTSSKDDSLAGDSNGDAAVSLPSAGDWKGIYLSPDSGASLLNHCSLRFAGATLGYYRNVYRSTTVFVDGCSPVITGSQFADSAGNGVEFWSSTATLKSNTFRNLGASSYAIVQDTLDTALASSDNSFSGGGQPGIAIPGGSIGSSVVWRKPGEGLSYFLTGELTVADGFKLTIDPGVVVKTSGQRVLVQGTLDAQGTVAEPIRFSSRSATPAPNDWLGIYFGPNAGNSVLRNATVEYTGGNLVFARNAYRNASIFVDGSSPTLDRVTVAHSGGIGIEIFASGLRLSGSTLRDCAAHALKIQAASQPILDNDTFAANGATGNNYTVAMDASSTPVVSNLTFTSNAFQGVQVFGGTLASSATWQVWAYNAPYVLTESVTVDAGVVLTIQPGAVVKNASKGLYVNGTLVADGTQAPIVFTSSKDDTAGGDSNGDGAATLPAAGNWKGIYLSPDSGKSVFNNCSFLYAGDTLGFYNNDYRSCAVYINSCSPTILQSTVADSAVHGIELWASAATISGTAFNNMGAAGYPIVFDTLNSFPVLSANSLAGTGSGGVRVPAGNVGESGVWTRPGNSFPYLFSGDVSLGQDVSLRIDPGNEIGLSSAGFYVGGRLTAVGTVDQPIRFTSRRATKAAGDWKGIYFGPTGTNSTFGFSEVSFGGSTLGFFHNDYRSAAVYLDNNSMGVANLTVSGSSANGIETYGAVTGIQSSVIASSAGNGVLVTGGGVPSVVNNTIVHNAGNGIQFAGPGGTAVNNIIASSGSAGIRMVSGGSARMNCMDSNAGGNYVGVVPSGDLAANPLFVNATAGNYRLNSGSPCVDVGLREFIDATSLDLDGAKRIAGSSVDIGAYEFGSVRPVVPVPVFTSAASVAAELGLAFHYQATATGNPTQFTASGLPSGLTIDETTGLISGVPGVAGSSSVTLTAKNATGVGSAVLQIRVIQAGLAVPSITSALKVSAQLGVAFTYVITAVNDPTSFTADGLPPGLSLDSNSGTITGLPTAVGTNSVVLGARNSAGAGTAILIVEIQQKSDVLFNNGNIFGVQSGPTQPTTFTVAEPFMVTFIQDYHYFNGGALPGTIALKHEDGTVYGPWHTTGSTGQGGVLNAYWNAEPQVVIKPGKYTVIDSDPSTWSQNSASGFTGFTLVQGYAVSQVVPALTLVLGSDQDVTATWPATFTGYALESTPVLGPSANWMPLSQSPAIEGDHYVLRFKAGNGNQFFRLRN